jgi:ketosteroid isomerase-like protein
MDREAPFGERETAPTPPRTDPESGRVVERLWGAMQARDWAAVGALLLDDFVCEWPQSGERIRGRHNYIELNRNYPGDWRIEAVRVVASGDEAASEVAIRLDGRTDIAASFYTLRGGKLLRETDYWPEPCEAPPWRARWVERF